VHLPLPTALSRNSVFLDFGSAIQFLIVIDNSLQAAEHAAFLLIVVGDNLVDHVKPVYPAVAQ
jgi:hypothetical protein